MSKKLWFLNLLLVAGLVMIGRELHASWKASREREKRMLGQRVSPVKEPPTTIGPPPAPVQATQYIDVAQQTLFSKDRNPNVVVEVPVEKPKIMPPFPKFFGVMNLGDGPMAIMTEGGRQKTFKAGEQIGEYKLLAIGTETLTFEWDGKPHVKKFSDLQAREAAPQVEERTAAPAAPVTPPAPVTPAKPGPGADMGGGLAACNANDSSPAGTVVDGKRKVVTESPFGKVCRWEPVR
ncbi:MAG: hypothetical protein JNK87_16025 [Bryobacterales bacterium]|nr:hypothetical protein [Bryobacterales bacterium]